LTQGDIVTCSTPIRSSALNEFLSLIGLNFGHAYSVLGTFTLKSVNSNGTLGSITDKFVYLRNP